MGAFRILSTLTAMLLCGELAAAEQLLDPGRFVTQSVVISGAVEHSLNLDVAQLRSFPVQQLTEVKLVCQSGADRGKLEDIKGVRLRDVLDRAKIKAPAHNDVKKMAIVARASDGYAVVFSWNEVFNSPLGDGVLVFFEKNGMALGQDEGRLALISAQDTRTGPRHVKWLQDISVVKVVE
ncbi:MULTISPECIES: molybdopterin-dependent oxidoreductase [unclassified Pseudomonas]|uniref:molybdopterin-dependent oxidoreductase n=1 Tax=unclassified Pseudomonas TaxID=196821 RepID=UPI002446C337|nr:MULTISPECIES: molybdopterin-dependent oxidoreductase [unclassified Pseudomonas]MDG9922971.1 molybdopterin-dependent oxidoreductase [Pseudomonas sp. GD04045]MDH0035665.1 molybdopterin-dependent oxidoreductase [Pseudomonas sp. GD04019]